MLRYEARLRRDLPSWTEQGWVTPDGAEAILRSVGSREGRFSLPGIVAVLGAVLLCFGVMTFVSANWAEISKGMRLLILFSALWSTYAACWVFRTMGYRLIFEAAALLSVGVFGASIMLISQTYHLDGNASDAVLLWALGALVMSVLATSRAALASASVLFVLWAGWDVFEQDMMPRPMFWLAWVIAAAAAWREEWKPGLHLSLLSLIAWLVLLAVYLVNQRNFDAGQTSILLTQIGLLVFVAAFASVRSESWLRGFERPLAAYGAAGILAGTFMTQFITGVTKSAFDLSAGPLLLAHAGLAAGAAVLLLWCWRERALKAIDAAIVLAASVLPLLLSADDFATRSVLAAVVIGLTIWAISFGLWHGRTSIKMAGYAAFGAELLYIYFRTLGSLMDTALFYLLAGFLMTVLGIGFAKLQRLRPSEQESEQ
ncbi:MAG: DUF2157 domain-containing protein [Pseudomonadota bacterium]